MKSFKRYLNKKEDKKTFDNMFSIARLYNSACFYASNPIRVYPIMMSIILPLQGFKRKKFDDCFSFDFNEIDNNENTIFF